jgi:hypothetical protein
MDLWWIQNQNQRITRYHELKQLQLYWRYRKNLQRSRWINQFETWTHWIVCHSNTVFGCQRNLCSRLNSSQKHCCSAPQYGQVQMPKSRGSKVSRYLGLQQIQSSIFEQTNYYFAKNFGSSWNSVRITSKDSHPKHLTNEFQRLFSFQANEWRLKHWNK